MTEHAEGLTRLAAAQDVPHLKALWKIVFEDDDEDIDIFFDTWFSPALTVVIQEGPTPVSAAYILPVGQIALRGDCREKSDRLDCAMIYAIATLPECRGRGYGEAVTRAAAELAAQKGYPAVVLKPAGDDLFEFYAKRSAFRDFFSAYIAELNDAELPLNDPRYSLSPVSPHEYRQLRQNFLEDRTYIDMDERGLSYQAHLCSKSGGGLFCLLYEGLWAGCAVIEPGEDMVAIKELLLSGGCGMPDAISAIAKLFPAKKYEVRALADDENTQRSGYRRFGMMVPFEGCPNIPYVYSAKWYGPAFD